MLRILTKDDVKEEYRDKVVRMIYCPTLQRAQAALMCFACSRLRTCKVPKELEISELAVEDVVHDADFFHKATLSRKQELSESASSTKKRKRKQVSEKKTQAPEVEKSDKETPSIGSEKQEVSEKGGNSMRGDKKKVVMEYLKANPNAKVSDVKKACNVSYVYASKIVKAFRSGSETSPPQQSS